MTGERVVEVVPCADIPYCCDGFDPADWPAGEVPDFSLFREWERQAGVTGCAGIVRACECGTTEPAAPREAAGGLSQVSGGGSGI